VQLFCLQSACCAVFEQLLVDASLSSNMSAPEEPSSVAASSPMLDNENPSTSVLGTVQGWNQKFHLGWHEAPKAPRSSAAGARIEAPQAPRGVGVGRGCPPPHWGRGLGRGLCPLPRKNFQYCIIKWPVLIDSDVLHVLLIVVVKLETCT